MSFITFLQIKISSQQYLRQPELQPVKMFVIESKREGDQNIVEL